MVEEVREGGMVEEVRKGSMHEVMVSPTFERVLRRLARRETKRRASLLSDSTHRRANAWWRVRGALLKLQL